MENDDRALRSGSGPRERRNKYGTFVRRRPVVIYRLIKRLLVTETGPNTKSRIFYVVNSTVRTRCRNLLGTTV